MFDIINCIIEQQEPIRIILPSDQRTAPLVPTWQDMDVLESMLAVLTRLHDFTDLLTGEKVTVSTILHLLHHIQGTILAANMGKVTTKEIEATQGC